MKYISKFFFITLTSVLIFTSCKDASPPPEADIVNTPEELKESASENIRKTLKYADENEGDIGDSTRLFANSVLQRVYEKNQYATIWSSSEQWNTLTDSLYDFIDQSKLYGLFPEDYHFEKLKSIRHRISIDSLSKNDRRDAALWSKADILFSDAYMHLLHDIKLGRLPQDSITLRKDSTLNDDFYEQQFNILLKAGSVTKTIRHLEPRHQGYHALKAGIKNFLDSADYTVYTRVPSIKEDSVNYKRLLQRRLFEGGYIAFDSIPADSLQLATAVKKVQKRFNITVDGKAGEGTLRLLNMTVHDQFLKIALSLDRYKLLPEKMPDRYIWVNIPSYFMKLQVRDTVKLMSKIICGKPKTRTPLLTSAISEIITYPQWTVPASIIEKEILPAIKRDPGYLARKGFSLVDKEGMEVDPFTVDWTKYKKGIPYKVVQGSGDDNALGVLKFNFPNKYAVYLHDTNQRSLFGQTVRSLSHGCVRVQEWQKLALFMIRTDSQDSTKMRPVEDSLQAWLERKEKHSIPVRNRLPVYIRYFTSEGTDRGIAFYDDVYGEDKRLIEAHFRGK